VRQLAVQLLLALVAGWQFVDLAVAQSLVAAATAVVVLLLAAVLQVPVAEQGPSADRPCLAATEPCSRSRSEWHLELFAAGVHLEIDSDGLVPVTTLKCWHRLGAWRVSSQSNLANSVIQQHFEEAPNHFESRLWLQLAKQLKAPEEHQQETCLAIFVMLQLNSSQLQA